LGARCFSVAVPAVITRGISYFTSYYWKTSMVLAQKVAHGLLSGGLGAVGQAVDPGTKAGLMGLPGTGQKHAVKAEVFKSSDRYAIANGWSVLSHFWSVLSTPGTPHPAIPFSVRLSSQFSEENLIAEV